MWLGSPLWLPRRGGPSPAPDRPARLPNTHPMFCRVKPLNYMLIGGIQAMGNVLRLLARRRHAGNESVAGETVTLGSPQAHPPSD